MSIHNILVPNNLTLYAGELIGERIVVNGEVITEEVAFSNPGETPNLSIGLDNTDPTDPVTHINIFNEAPGAKYDIMDFVPYDATDNEHRSGRIDVNTLYNSNPASNNSAAIYFNQGLNIVQYDNGIPGLTASQLYNHTVFREFYSGRVTSTSSANITATSLSVLLSYTYINGMLMLSVIFTNSGAGGVTVTLSSTQTSIIFADIIMYNLLGTNLLQSTQYLRDNSGPVIYTFQQNTLNTIRLTFTTPDFDTLPAGSKIALQDATGTQIYML